MREVIEARPSWGRRLVGIEGLRGLAALSVVFHHTAASTTDHAVTGLLGNIGSFAREGLTLFFVLSGFLLFRPFVEAVMRGDSLPSIRRYAANRLLRIYPAYVVVFILTALVIGTVYVRASSFGNGPENVGRLTDPMQIFANALAIQTYFPSYVLTGIGPAWSLTAEIAFYCFLPLLVLVAQRLSNVSGRTIWPLVIGPVFMIVTGLAIRTWANAQLSHLNQWDAAMFEWGQTGAAVLIRSFLGQADLFAYGMLTAVLLAFLHSRGVDRIPTRVKIGLLGFCVLLVAMAFTFLRAYDTNITGVAAALLVVAVVLPSSSNGHGNRLAQALEWLPSRFVGLISYSIYLWHLPVILWLTSHHQTFGSDTRSMFPNLGLVLAVVLPLATITYYLVERPALKLKKKQGRRRRVGLTPVRDAARL